MICGVKFLSWQISRMFVSSATNGSSYFWIYDDILVITFNSKNPYQALVEIAFAQVGSHELALLGCELFLLLKHFNYSSLFFNKV